MGWERGRYYTRSRREGGRVIREYVGRGPFANVAAHEDQARQQRREAERRTWRQEQEQVRRLEQPLEELDSLCALLMWAAFEDAGYRRHDRGEWRRRRG